MTIVAAKLALATAGAIAAILLTRWERLFALPRRRFDAALLVALAASRLAVFVALYAVLRQPVRSDVPLFYVPQGLAALEGRVPYRDFATSYAPLFPWVVAAVLAAWRSPLAVVLFAIVVEVATLPGWLRVLRAWTDEPTVRVAALLDLTSAIPITAVAVNGGNHAWCAPFLVGSLLLARRAPAASGALMALGADVVKALAVLLAPAPLLLAASRRAWALGFVAAIALVYGGLFALGGDPLLALRAEVDRITAGNLPFVLAVLGGGDALDSAVGGYAGALFAALAALLVVPRLGRPLPPAAVPSLAAVVLLLFMLLSKKAYAPYLVMAFPVLCAVAARGWPRRAVVAWWAAFCIAGTAERSAWAALDSPTTLAGVLAARGPGVLLLALDATVVASHAALAWMAWRQLRGREASIAEARSPSQSARTSTLS